jgi:sulfite reductase beta subunit-like hemoprotein
VALRKLGDALSPLLDRFATERDGDEGFGDWSDRVGTDELSGLLAAFGRTTREDRE